MKKRPKIAVILTCFNRKALTLRALQSLHESGAPFDLHVFLFEDGSTDGTRESVADRFPEVTIIPGDGSAYWNGGMYRAWRHAARDKFDGYFWLNDDVLLDRDAFDRLGEQWDLLGGWANPLILVGPTRTSAGQLSYGGLNRDHSPFALRFKKLEMGSTLARSDTFHGNIVLISQAMVDRIGLNDPAFFHALGDIDYGLRAKKAGFAPYIMPGTLGICEANDTRTFKGLPFRQRLRRVNSHLGLPVASWLRMTRRWSGLWLPLHFILPYRKLFVEK